MAEKEKKEEAQYALPSSQVDLNRRRENGNQSEKVLSTSDAWVPPDEDFEVAQYAVEGNDTENYINVDPIYQTYANETEAPLVGDGDSAEVEAFKNREGELGRVGELPSKEDADDPQNLKTAATPTSAEANRSKDAGSAPASANRAASDKSDK